MCEIVMDKFPVLRTLDRDVKASVEKILVFNDKQGHNAFVITKDDNVFATGSNDEGCLRTGEDGEYKKARKITALCRKEILNISVGYGYFRGHGWSMYLLALSADGSVYSWGRNDKGQLGNGTTNHGPSPALVNNIQHKKIVQVACGAGHSLALSDDGEIYAWGYNGQGQIGSDTRRTDQLVPLKVTSQIGTRRAISIACGGLHSVALLDNGEVYTWGDNDEGQLGLGNNDHQSIPCKVEALSGEVITQIVCGHGHTLVLSQKGSIYSWGWNGQGQLGTGDKTDYNHPEQIRIDQRFIEIAADKYGGSLCISAGLTDTGKVYMWGGGKHTSPYLTEYTIIDEVFANIPDEPFTWRLCSVERGVLKPNRKHIGIQTDIDSISFRELRVQLDETKKEKDILMREKDILMKENETLRRKELIETDQAQLSGYIHQKAIKKCWFQLVKDIGDPADICDVLISKEILSHDKVEEIMAEKTNQARCRHLLNVVRVRGESAFDAFLTALRDCHRKHLADQLDNAVSEASGGNR